MNDILAYSLTDFLMFTPQSYLRTIELYNRAMWPAHVPVAALTLWTIAVTRDASDKRARLVSLLLALLWAAIAWRYFLQHYAAINLAAPWFAFGFGVQAVLLLAVGAGAGRLRYAWHAAVAGRAGLGLLLFAVFIVPALGPLAGRSWQAVELFGVAPDATALGTAGLLLMAPGSWRWWLMPLPLLWCAISVLTYVAMAMKG